MRSTVSYTIWCNAKYDRHKIKWNKSGRSDAEGGCVSNNIRYAAVLYKLRYAHVKLNERSMSLGATHSDGTPKSPLIKLGLPYTVS